MDTHKQRDGGGQQVGIRGLQSWSWRRSVTTLSGARVQMGFKRAMIKVKLWLTTGLQLIVIFMTD